MSRLAARFGQLVDRHAASKLARDGFELGRRLARRPAPSRHDAVIRVARHDVNVVVEDRLEARGLVRLVQRDPAAAETLALPEGDLLRAPSHGLEVVTVDVEDVPSVPPRDDERVPLSSRLDG